MLFTDHKNEDLSVIDDEMPIEANKVNLNVKKEIDGIMNNLI